jgi:hypothetical protein
MLAREGEDAKTSDLRRGTGRALLFVGRIGT